jgi:hypothetical protein
VAQEAGGVVILTLKVLNHFHRWEGMNQPGKVPPLDSSGITIGWGCDLGQYRDRPGLSARDAFALDWRDVLPPDHYNRLRSVVGFRGAQAQGAALGLRDIIIKRDAADKVFNRMFDRYAMLTLKVFPGLEAYPPDVQGIFVAIVYNRGAAMDDDPSPDSIKGREGMSECAALIAAHAECQELGEAVHAMSQNWQDAGADGLHARYAEACAIIQAADDPPGMAA